TPRSCWPWTPDSPHDRLRDDQHHLSCPSGPKLDRGSMVPSAGHGVGAGDDLACRSGDAGGLWWIRSTSIERGTRLPTLTVGGLAVPLDRPSGPPPIGKE